MALFSMWRELENRVYKTRFIIQNFFKNLPSLKHSLTSPDRIRSERRRPDKRERKSQIKEGEKEIARACPGCATWVAQVARPRSREPQAARPRSRGLGGLSRSLSLPLWSDSFSLSLLSGLHLSDLTLSLSDLIRSGKVKLCLRLGRFLKYFWIINRV